MCEVNGLGASFLGMFEGDGIEVEVSLQTLQMADQDRSEGIEAREVYTAYWELETLVLRPL
jgi:hypothetical protein